MLQSGAGATGQGKAGKTEAELLADILKELSKRDGDVGAEMGKGGAVAQAFLEAYFQPQTEQDRAVQSLLKMEMAERSGIVPKDRRKDFVRMREFLEVQAGVRSPDEVDKDVFDSDKGFGYMTRGDRAHFIGDDGPDGRPREYVTGSPEFKERLQKMETQRKRHDGVLSEPGRIMQRYQDVYDQHEKAKKQAGKNHSQWFDQNTASYGGRVGEKHPAPGVTSQQHEWLNSAGGGVSTGQSSGRNPPAGDGSRSGDLKAFFDAATTPQTPQQRESGEVNAGMWRSLWNAVKPDWSEELNRRKTEAQDYSKIILGQSSTAEKYRQ